MEESKCDYNMETNLDQEDSSISARAASGIQEIQNSDQIAGEPTSLLQDNLSTYNFEDESSVREEPEVIGHLEEEVALEDSLETSVQEEIIPSKPEVIGDLEAVSLAVALEDSLESSVQEEIINREVIGDLGEEISFAAALEDSLQLLSEIENESFSDNLYQSINPYHEPLGMIETAEKTLPLSAENEGFCSAAESGTPLQTQGLSSVDQDPHAISAQDAESANKAPEVIDSEAISTGTAHEDGVLVDNGGNVRTSANDDSPNSYPKRDITIGEQEDKGPGVDKQNGEDHVVVDVALQKAGVMNEADQAEKEFSDDGIGFPDNDSAKLNQDKDTSICEEESVENLSQIEINDNNPLAKYPPRVFRCFVNLADCKIEGMEKQKRRRQKRRPKSQKYVDEEDSEEENARSKRSKRSKQLSLERGNTDSANEKDSAIGGLNENFKRPNVDNTCEPETKKMKIIEPNMLQPFSLLMQPSNEFFGALDVIKDQLLELRMQNTQLSKEAQLTAQKKEKFESEIKRLEEQLEASNDENSKLKKQNSSQATSFRRRNAVLQQQLLAQSEKSESEIKKLTKRLEKSEQEVTKLTKEKENFEATVAQMSLTITQLSSTNESKKMTTESSQYFENIRKTLQTVVLKQDSELCENVAVESEVMLQDFEVEELVNSILIDFSDGKKQQVTDIQNCILNIKNLEGKKFSYKKTGIKLNKKVKELHAELESEMEAKKETEKQIHGKNKQIQNLDKEIKSKDRQIGKLEKEISSKETQLAKVKEDSTKIKELTKVLASQTKTHMNDLAQMQKLKNDIRKKEKEIEELQSQADKIELLEYDVVEKKIKIEQLEKDVGVVQEIRNLLDEKDDKIKRLQSFLIKCQDWAQQLLSKNKEITDLKQHIVRLQEAEKQLAIKDKRIEQFQSEIIRLRKLEKEILDKDQKMTEMEMRLMKSEEMERQLKQKDDVIVEWQQHVARLQETEKQLAIKDKRIEKFMSEIIQLKKLEKEILDKDQKMTEMATRLMKTEEMKQQLKKKDDIIIDLQLQSIRVSELEKKLKRKEKKSFSEEKDDKSIARLALLENQISLKDKTISKLTKKCSEAEHELKRKDEQLNNSIDVPSQGPQKFEDNVKELNIRLTQQAELIESLQWTLYIIDNNKAQQLKLTNDLKTEKESPSTSEKSTKKK